MTKAIARTAGIVLAAGDGTRFGGPKAPFEIDGERLIDRSVRILRDGGCSPVVAVLGAWQGEVDDAVIVVNDRWREGMGSSLRIGLEYVRSQTDALDAVITLVDLPGLTVAAIERVFAAPPGIAVATFAGQRGHPVRIPREHFDELIETVNGDQGARSFLSMRTDVGLVEMADIADGSDLDYAPDPS